MKKLITTRALVSFWPLHVNGLLFALTVLLTVFLLPSCQGKKPYVDPAPPEHYTYVSDSTGTPFEIHFARGRYHNHPLMVFWLEDTEGKYLRTIYVATSIGKGVFRYGTAEEGFWKPGEIQRPAALPVWGHKRGVKNEFGNMIPSPAIPVPDAMTGPTPKRNFVLHTNTGKPLPRQFVVKMEINQTWDFNEFWTNDKFPGNDEYITSCQPALVYEARINLDELQNEYTMLPIGHSHYDGSDGAVTRDLSTITTALQIAREVKVIFQQQ
jgi:hypothetical protein